MEVFWELRVRRRRAVDKAEFLSENRINSAMIEHLLWTLTYSIRIGNRLWFVFRVNSFFSWAQNLCTISAQARDKWLCCWQQIICKRFIACSYHLMSTLRLCFQNECDLCYEECFFLDQWKTCQINMYLYKIAVRFFPILIIDIETMLADVR